MADVIKPDLYQLHSIALGPLLPGVSEEDIVDFCNQAAALDETEFLAFLHQQGLAPLWDKVFENPRAASQLPENFKNSVHEARMRATGTYLIQSNQLVTIKSILDVAAISHAVYKGAHTRERYYTEPSLRPAVDIDILVPDRQKIRAIIALNQHGFEFHATPENISHEANLVKGATSIDLHWDIMRPGRTRIPMTDTLLETRQDYGSHWGMSDEANLFVLLVHQVFVRYTTTPQATLMRIVDLVQLIGREKLRWEETIELLEMAGLKTAAWITLRWLLLLTGQSAELAVLEKLRPGKLRQTYLNWWLEKNLATRFLNKPGLVQLGFTLPAHDKATDALRAIRLKHQANQNAAGELQAITSSLV
jgi:Uncharacterised nucleotidyltransferase